MDNEDRLLSHKAKSIALEDAIKAIHERILSKSNPADVTVQYQLQLVNQLFQFELGQFLLINNGVNGYWTDYILSGHFGKIDKLSDLEKSFLTKLPTVLATQQRFQFFLNENQKNVKNNADLLCIPCGLMGELLYLNYENIENINLVGIDLDPESLLHAEQNAKKKNLKKWVNFHQMDAWNIVFENEFNLITSNGLTIYEPDNDKVTDLYSKFYLALKPGGKLVTSFLTPPPSSADCEWDMTKIDIQALELQRVIFQNILLAKWQCYRSSNTTKQQLESVGFKDVKFLYDKAKMFPTVVGYK